MEWFDRPFIQGRITLNPLESPLYVLTGNPRYENLKMTPLPPEGQVLINCTFTYGIHADQREQWIQDCVGTSLGLGLRYSMC